MPKGDVIIAACFALFCGLMITFMVSVIISVQQSEINMTRYSELAILCSKSDAVKQKVESFMEDGKISNHEYGEIIMGKYRGRDIIQKVIGKPEKELQ